MIQRHRSLLAAVAVSCGLSMLALTGCEGGHAAAQGATVARSSAGPTQQRAFEPDLTMGNAALRGSPPGATSSTLDVMSVVAPPLRPVTYVADRNVRMPTDWFANLDWNGGERVAHAKRAKAEVVNKLFEDAGVAFPPHDLLFRIFKKERQFEVWAGDKGAPMKRVATYGICAASGELGPKRNEGDSQVPEGYYKVGYYHPMSAYYLSAQVDYPNASDKIRGGSSPGGDILIHGRCASIGCVAMTDERIEEIYLMGWGAFMNGRPTAIHIFPSRDLDALLADEKYVDNHDFWREIKPGLEAFDRSHLLPTVRIDKQGRYVISEAGSPTL